MVTDPVANVQLGCVGVRVGAAGVVPGVHVKVKHLIVPNVKHGPPTGPEGVTYTST